MSEQGITQEDERWIEERRLAALEQRVGGIVETLWAEPDTETAEYRRRLAALRSPAPEVDGLRAQVAAAERSEDRLTREVLTARRERDEAMGVVRRYLAWLDGPDGPHALQAIVADMRALASGQPSPDPRGAEIERLRARIAGARRLHVGVATWLRQNAHDWPSTPGHTDTCFCCLKVRECDAWLAEKDAPDPRDAEIETLRAKLAEAERCAQESADIMRRARDRAESYCLRLGEAESQRDALRAHALKLDGLCERVLESTPHLLECRSAGAGICDACRRRIKLDSGALRARGEVPR